MEKLDGLSLDLEKQNIDKLKELFPIAVEEGKINFDLLRAILGDEVDESKEKYQFTWKGKSESIKLAQTPSAATLRPCKDKSKDWDSTDNLYIEGDNLEVLKQLQKTYYGKIKMIYIDPPYNTGNDFVYEDNFKDSLENYKKQTNQVNSANPETNGKFHTKWLNLIYPRLLLAKNLLKDDGVIFVSINEKEYSNLKLIMNEIFGEINFITSIHWQSKSGGSADESYIVDEVEYILSYAKAKNKLKLNRIVVENDPKYTLQDKYVKERGKYLLKKMDFRMTSSHYTESLNYPIIFENQEIWPGGKNYRQEGGWNYRWSKEKLEWGLKNEFIVIKKNESGYTVYSKQYEKVDNNGNPIRRSIPYRNLILSQLINTSQGSRVIVNEFGSKVFEYSKPVDLLKLLINMVPFDDGDYILDFFSGAATTAHAVMKVNAEDGTKRKFIMVQLPELCDEKSEAYKAGFKNICEIGEERIRRTGEQIREEWEKNHPQNTLLSLNEQFGIDIGFKVFKLDSTNIILWDNLKQYREHDLLNFDEVFKKERNKEDVLYEILIKYGLFDKKIKEVELNNKTMYRVGRRYMIICLEDNITTEDVKAIGSLSPKTVVFKESGFKNDNVKINAIYNLQTLGVEDIKSI